MKLSEVLKDWDKEMENRWYQASGQDYYSTEDAYKDGKCVGYNSALTSCDREIDRDALENVLLNMIVDFISDDSMESADKIHGYKDRIIDSFISTMPTWLRKVSEK